MSNDGSTTSPPADVQHIRLACQACQRKKIKCDRTFPCGQCTKSSLTCVPSSRKQRVRHGAKRAVDGELRSRIAKLESLVKGLSNDPVTPTEKPDGPEITPPTRTNSIDVNSPVLGKYMANTFWSSLTEEVGALREALEEEDDDEDTPEPMDGQITSPPRPGPDIDHDLLVCPPGRIYVMPGVLPDPEPHLRAYLIETFFNNAEPMVKIFHRPTLRATIDHNADYLGHQPGSIVHDGIRRLVWLAAYNTLSEAEVLSLTGQNKLDVIKRYRRYVGICMSQLDLMKTDDLATLQCLTFFITVCRTHDNSRRTWTSLALLVRNAQAMYMNQDDPRATPFIRELRKRLWHNIRLLDKYCALDRGSSQLIRNEEWTIPYPTNTNDDLFGPDSMSIPELYGRPTDMLFAIMCFESCSTMEALIIPEIASTGPTWQQRRKLAVDMGVMLEEKYMRFLDLSDPLQRLQHAIGKSICTAMMVRAVRPMQRNLSASPPPVDSPEVLQMAVDNLECAHVLFKDNETERWKWVKWVPWHCLAVTLAGLCSIRDTPLADKAWSLVGPSFKWCGQHIADGEDGMLWRPITKLYRKATAFRAGASKAVKVQPSAESKDSVKAIPAATMDASTDWPQPWSADDDLLLPTSNVDHLSNGFSSMTPFNLPVSTQPFSGTDLPILGPSDLPAVDFSSTYFNDTSWTDWGQMTDEFNDPLATGDGSMDGVIGGWNPDEIMSQI